MRRPTLLAARAVESAVDGALGEVNRQCGDAVHQILVEARGVGMLSSKPALLCLEEELDAAGSAKIYVIHTYDDGELRDYFVHATEDAAVQAAAAAVVVGIGGHPDHVAEVLKRRVVEPGVGRTHVKCGTWTAHVDVLELGK